MAWPPWRVWVASQAWAMTPYSAVWCMASVRMWTDRLSPGLITVVCSDQAVQLGGGDEVSKPARTGCQRPWTAPRAM